MSSYRPVPLNRKRRRNHVPALFSSDLNLEIENRNQAPANEHIPDDERVFRLLDKVTLATPSSYTSPTTLVFTVTASERIYLESQEIPALLREKLGIIDFEIAQQAVGSIESLAIAYGNRSAVVKTAVYLSFCLCAKIKDVARWSTHTLKSLNFKLQLLVPRIHETVINEIATTSELTSVDVCFNTAHYCASAELQCLQIRSDIHSMVVFLVKLLELEQFEIPLQMKDFTTKSLFAVMNEPALYIRSPSLKKTISDSKQSILEFAGLS